MQCLDESDDEDVEYTRDLTRATSLRGALFLLLVLCAVRGWVRGFGGVGLWAAGPGCECCEDYDWEISRVLGFGYFFLILTAATTTPR